MRYNPHIILLVIILIGLIALLFVDIPKEQDYQQTIDSLRTDREQIRVRLTLLQDSLEVTLSLLHNQQVRLDSLIAEIDTTTTVYEKIVYRNYTDSQRDSVLTVLYPSFRHSR